MARIRSAKPDFWTDPLMCSLPRDIRFTFKGIWEVCADDSGRFLADSRVIKGKVWPLDDDVTLKKIEKYVLSLADCGRIVLYVVHGVRYGYVVNWFKHQQISHPKASTHPEPPPENFRKDSGAVPEIVRSDSGQSGAELIRDEGNRAERSRESVAEEIARAAVREDLDPTVRDDDRAAPPAPRVVLPVDAERFLEQLYSLGSEKRRLDVRRQLFDALDTVGKGARLRQGVYVKARDAEHLAFCCRAVVSDPPRNIDAAIVVLLEKLKDPPAGPTPSELHKASETTRIEGEEAYQRAARSAGILWAKQHPAEYEPIRAALAAEFDHADNTFSRIAKEAALIQRCSKAAGFPDFETWKKKGYSPPLAAPNGSPVASVASIMPAAKIDGADDAERWFAGLPPETNASIAGELDRLVAMQCTPATPPSQRGKTRSIVLVSLWRQRQTANTQAVT